MEIRKTKVHSEPSSQSVKKCSTSLGEIIFFFRKKTTTTFKNISPGRVKRYGEEACPSQQMMEEKAILKNIGKNYILS